jgi:hypothetical protein
MIAASGIDNTIKIFSSDRTAQSDASLGINILDPDFRGNRPGVTHTGGLESRKRIHDSYRIMSENDVERRGGMSEAYITVCFPMFLLNVLSVLTVYTAEHACSPGCYSTGSTRRPWRNGGSRCIRWGYTCCFG